MFHADTDLLSKGSDTKLEKQKKPSIGIPHQCIKLAVEHISEALTVVFNNSLERRIMPDILRVSRVTPIFKT